MLSLIQYDKSIPKSKTGRGLIMIVVESTVEQPFVSKIETVKVVVFKGATVGEDEELLIKIVSPTWLVIGVQE